MGRFLAKVLILITIVLLLIIQLYKNQDSDVISQVLSLEYVRRVDPWPQGIKFARWNMENESPVDWEWLKILDKLLVPGDIFSHPICPIRIATTVLVQPLGCSYK